MTTLPCERSYCDNAAELIASRVDASRDYIYLCEGHRIAEPTVFEQSALPRRAAELAAEPQPQLTLEMTLTMWPPKHRNISLRAARAIAAPDAELVTDIAVHVRSALGVSIQDGLTRCERCEGHFTESVADHIREYHEEYA